MPPNWVTPKTWSGGGGFTSAELNQEIRDNLLWLKAALTTTGITSDSALSVLLGAPYHVRARRTSNQSTSNGTGVSIQFTASDDFDSHGMHSTVSNTQRITVPAGGAGYYLIGGGATFEANNTGLAQISLELNGINGAGTELLGSAQRSGDATLSALKLSTVLPYHLSVGDYVAFSVVQNSGGSLNVTEAAFWAVRYAAD